jgi:hypothetical protein
MTTLVKGQYSGGFLVWETFRDYTRETVTIAPGAGKLAPGTVLGKITSGGKYTVLTPGASNGSQNAAGILWGQSDATDADAAAVVLVRGPAIVNRHEIIWPDGITEGQTNTAIAALTALGILQR